jgi:acyl carrier protein
MRNQDLIREFIVDVFLPGVQPEQLRPDYDLIASGTIDSLSLLRILTWLEGQFGIPIDDVEFAEHDFTSVASICEFVDRETGRSAAASKPADKEEK